MVVIAPWARRDAGAELMPVAIAPWARRRPGLTITGLPSGQGPGWHKMMPACPGCGTRLSVMLWRESDRRPPTAGGGGGRRGGDGGDDSGGDSGGPGGDGGGGSGGPSRSRSPLPLPAADDVSVCPRCQGPTWAPGIACTRCWVALTLAERHQYHDIACQQPDLQVCRCDDLDHHNVDGGCWLTSSRADGYCRQCRAGHPPAEPGCDDGGGGGSSESHPQSIPPRGGPPGGDGGGGGGRGRGSAPRGPIGGDIDHRRRRRR
jgi:hypothetical protein